MPMRAKFLGEMGFAKAIKVSDVSSQHRRNISYTIHKELLFAKFSGLRFTALEARNKVGRSTTLKQGSLSRPVFRV